MKKEFLLTCSILVIAFAVNAQTFQRKVKQPAFFMPKSALSTQKQERLPAIENMNYQGKRAPSTLSAIDSVQAEQKANQNSINQSKISTTELNENKKEQKETVAIKEKKVEEIKQTTPVVAKKIKDAPSNDHTNLTVAKTENPENYQALFTEIMHQHKADLADISQGKSVKNPNIEAVTEAFKPQVYTINDTIQY